MKLQIMTIVTKNGQTLTLELDNLNYNTTIPSGEYDSANDACDDFSLNVSGSSFYALEGYNSYTTYSGSSLSGTVNVSNDGNGNYTFDIDIDYGTGYILSNSLSGTYTGEVVE